VSRVGQVADIGGQQIQGRAIIGRLARDGHCTDERHGDKAHKFGWRHVKQMLIAAKEFLEQKTTSA
jgi:hypothetical protein